jgi:serine acetyltransferase
MTLAVVLVNDVATGSAAPDLCRRPAVDWLLDTVEALSPDTLAIAGTDTGPLRDRIAQRPVLDALAAVAGTAVGAVTLVLPCSVPLVRPATLRRVIDSLAGGAPGRAAVLELAPPAPWWAERDGATRPAVVAAAGTIGIPVAELTAITVTRHLTAAGKRVRTGRVTGVEALSINDPGERVHAENALYERIAAGWLARGVIVEDPVTTRIDATVHIGEGARIRPNTELLGETVIGPGSRIGPMTTVRDSHVGARCQIQYAVCQDVEIGDDAMVGPFSWLRSGTRLGARCRAGAFVELADSAVGEGTSIPHLGGLFSADVGRNCNIAGMSAPANFDGQEKHRVRIGDGVLIGAGNILVAPVTIGDGAATAAGSVITEDVPDGALGMARAPQRTIAGWAAFQRARGQAAS